MNTFLPACPSFNITYPPMRTVTLLCPGDIITYTCAFSTSTLIVATQWSGSGFTCPANNPPNIIQLTQPTGAGTSLNTVPGSCGNLSAVMIDQHQWNMLHLCPHHTYSSIFQWNHSHVQRWHYWYCHWQ